MNKNISILGGGIAGLTTAISLQQAGIKTTIFEAAPTIKAIGAGIALAANAMVALDQLGLMEEAVQLGRVLPSFSIYDNDGELITSTNSQQLSARFGVDNFTIHRAELHRLLLSKIEADSIHTGKKVTDIEQHEDSVTIMFEDGTKHESDFVIAADGIHSVVRKKLLPDSEPRYAGYTCWRAVIDNTELNITESSETWGTKNRFGIVPLANKQLYWFACINAEQNSERFRNYNTRDLLNHFRDFHDPIPAILRDSWDENLIWNDIIDLKPLHKFAFNNILLIGDAAHATTPNMGQGACQAIEDAVVLADELKKSTDIPLAFKNFENRRMQRTKFITNTSWNIGRIAQIENKLLASVRNFIFRRIPSAVNEKQLKKLYEVDF